MNLIHIQEEVDQALRSGLPVVAMESAVITSGLPRDPLPAASRLRAPSQPSQGLADWDVDAPVNLELGRAMQRVVRQAGATPATVAVVQGQLCIGLNDDELEVIAADSSAGKASVTDLAHIMATRGTAGTTVSGTLAAISIVNRQWSIVNPFTFATGGIGGVHRDWQQHLDVSADLRQIAATPVCIVCSGAKSILDLLATLEMLEALGVPVIGWQTNQFPQFFSRGTDELQLTKRIDRIQDAVAMCDLHWNALDRREGILLCNPPPQEFALDSSAIQSAILQAEDTAHARGIHGAARTPFLLNELSHLTRGRSLDANLALLLDNARLASELATAMANHRANT